MRTIIVLLSVMIIWVMVPAMAVAKDRDHHDRQYGKDRDHYAYKAERDRDHRYSDHRQGKEWRKHRHLEHEKRWRQHRKERHVAYYPYRQRVVYRPAPTRIVYREPVVYYPSSYVSIGVPNVSLRFSW